MKKPGLLFALLFALTSFAQTITPKNTGSSRYIEVVGTATNEIDPDQIFVSITLSEKSIDNKKFSIESQEEKLKQLLKKLNIDSKNLSLADLSSQIIRDKKNEIGFRQSKEYILLLSSAEEVSKVFQELFNANIKEADVIKTQHTNIQQYIKAARIDAVKAAKNKAEYLLEAIGSKIDEPLEIIEQKNYSEDFNSYRGNVYSGKNYERREMAEQPLASSEFKKITISISYKVKYAIK